MSLKGIFSGRDLLSFYCKKLFIAAWLLKEAQTRHSPRTSWGGCGCTFQICPLHPPSAVPPRTRAFFWNRNKHALRLLQPGLPHRFIALPGNAVWGARRRATAWPAARTVAASPSRAGARGDGGAERGGQGRRGGPRGARARGKVAGAAGLPLPGDRPTPPPRDARALGSPRRSPCPHNQVRPTYLTPRAGRRAGGRKEGRAAGDGLAWEAASGPTWRGLRGPREGNRGSGPTHSQRVPADADAEAQAAQLTTSLRDPRRRQRRLTASLRAGELAGGARAQAVDRRNRPAAAAAATEGAGTGAGRTRGAPHPGNGCRRSPAPPPAPLHLQRSLRLLERGEEERGSPPSLGLFRW